MSQQGTGQQQDQGQDQTGGADSAEAAPHVHGPGCNHHHHHHVQPFVRSAPKVGRNDPCVCGSGQKFKKCCGKSAT